VFHTWDWLAFHPTFHQTTLGLFSGLTFLAAACGIAVYGVLYRKLASGGKSARGRVRQWHRRIGLAFSAVLLLASISGSYHALYKLAITEPSPVPPATTFVPAALPYPLHRALALAVEQGPVIDMALVETADGPQWRFTHPGKPKPLAPTYVSARSGTVWEGGDHAQARWLACRHSGFTQEEVFSVETVGSFTSEFGFVQRRLPVVKVQFRQPENPRYYIETATGIVAWQARDIDAYERFSFRYLHKWGFADFLGPNVRDAIMVALTLGCTLVAALGIVLLIFGAKLSAGVQSNAQHDHAKTKETDAPGSGVLVDPKNWTTS